MDISIVVPSWNGLVLLQENLPSVKAAAAYYRRQSNHQTEILVVDDGSEDGTREVVEAEFPEICLIKSSCNRGFAATCNLGFQQARYPLVALLNNDVRIEQDYLLYQATHFQDPDVFAVTAKVFSWDGSHFTAGGRFGHFRRGFWSVYRNYDVANERPGKALLSAYAVGGFATYDKKKIDELKGFNTLLSPFHWEDIDLSYRGWKRGWQINYEPRSLAYHRISATIENHFTRHRVKTIAVRNRLLFHWINIHSTSLWIRHLLGLLSLVLTKILVLDWSFYRSFFGALSCISEVRVLRLQERILSRRSDLEVFEILRNFYQVEPIQVYSSGDEVKAKHPGLPAGMLPPDSPDD